MRFFHSVLTASFILFNGHAWASLGKMFILLSKTINSPAVIDHELSYL